MPIKFITIIVIVSLLALSGYFLTNIFNTHPPSINNDVMSVCVMADSFEWGDVKDMENLANRMAEFDFKMQGLISSQGAKNIFSGISEADGDKMMYLKQAFKEIGLEGYKCPGMEKYYSIF